MVGMNVYTSTQELVNHAVMYGGATVKEVGGIFLDIGRVHPNGYMVALPGSENPMGRLWDGRINKFLMLHPLIGQGVTYLGIWYDDTEVENDRPWFIEESMWFEYYPHAMNYARYWGQRYIWDINSNTQLEVND